VISKWVVWDAYEMVKAKPGAAGVDGESIAEFEKDLKGTSTSSGIGCPRGAISRRRSGRGDTEQKQGCAHSGRAHRG